MEPVLHFGASMLVGYALRMHALECGVAVALATLVDHVAKGYLHELCRADGFVPTGINQQDRGDIVELHEEKDSEPALRERQVEAIRMVLTATVLGVAVAAISAYSGQAFMPLLGQVAIVYNAGRIVTLLRPADEKA